MRSILVIPHLFNEKFLLLKHITKTVFLVIVAETYHKFLFEKLLD